MTREETIKALHDTLDSVDITFPHRLAIVEAIEHLSIPEPQGLDEAAEEAYPDERVVLARGNTCLSCGRVKRAAFKAGAKWMADQGLVKETQVYADRWTDVDVVNVSLGQGEYGFKAGDKVIVQIRKAE